jgi:predicted kinase
MPTAHLICGPPGAGKTSYAIALAARAHAVIFSTEQWLAALFAADAPEAPSLEWTLERIDRCEKQIEVAVTQILTAGASVVLDIGLPRANDRDRWRAHVAGTIAESKLHYLDVSREIRRMRVLGRKQLGRFDITETLFERMEIRFEPPTDDELYGAMIVCEE